MNRLISRLWSGYVWVVRLVRRSPTVLWFDLLYWVVLAFTFNLLNSWFLLISSILRLKLRRIIILIAHFNLQSRRISSEIAIYSRNTHAILQNLAHFPLSSLTDLLTYRVPLKCTRLPLRFVSRPLLFFQPCIQRSCLGLVVWILKFQRIWLLLVIGWKLGWKLLGMTI